MTKRHPDEVTPEFWTNERLRAFLDIWRGEERTDPNWDVYWDYATWTFYFVDKADPDWWKWAPEEHPGGVRCLCKLGEMGDPMPEVDYLIDEPPPAPWLAPWLADRMYKQMEMDL
jgi:hypothetical protein